jgi:hypothetical protein
MVFDVELVKYFAHFTFANCVSTDVKSLFSEQTGDEKNVGKMTKKAPNLQETRKICLIIAKYAQK